MYLDYYLKYSPLKLGKCQSKCVKMGFAVHATIKYYVWLQRYMNTSNEIWMSSEVIFFFFFLVYQEVFHISARLDVCIFMALCVTAVGSACLRVNPQRHKAPMPLCSCQQPPHSPRLRLGRSWGLTFHFSDPLFHRANSYAGLEMCYVAGWDKNQGQFQNNLRPRASRLFLSFTFAASSLRWHHLHYELDRQQGHHLHSGHSSLCGERDSVSQTQLFSHS